MFEILNDSGVQDIRYLENNSTIVNLTLHDCGLDDRAIDIVKTIPNLANLSLADNYIENINNLNGLSGLLSLNVSSNRLENVDVVATLNNLTRLDCSYNYITDVSSLTSLTKLTGLDISYNFIDVDGTQKSIVDSVPVQYNKETTPQRAVTGDTLIEMNVGDEIPFFFDSKQLQGNGYNIAEISNRGYRSIFGYYIIASDDVNLLEVVNTTVPYGSGSTTFKALKSGETKVKVLFRNIDSVLTKSEITIKIKDVPKPVIKGSYTVEYQDEKGNILDSKALNDLTLGSYFEVAKFIDGYTLDDVNNKSVELTETEPNKTIVFKYKKNEEPKPIIKGSYKVEYQDENGNLLDSKTLNDLVLGNYIEFAKFFDGYTLIDDTMKSFDLTETEPSKTIVFKYVKNEEPKPVIKGSYTVKFQDEEGNVLDSKSFNDLVLGRYVAFAYFIDGYTLNDEGTDMASFIHNEMRKHGVKLLLGRTVEGFEEKDETIRVLLKDEQPLHADLVVLAIGVTPDTHLAKEAGLQLGIKDSIVVNDRMETSIPDIYAAGDAVMVKHYVTGRDALISLAGPANKQGRIIADNICGGDSHYLGSQGSSVIKVFDLTAATTGINETNARKAGLDVDTVILSPMNHAGYYPGGKVMTMKVVFEKNTYRLLGAQIVGYEGVDKRIDVLSTAIHANLKATSLQDLDLAYAPPYSSAKDPVNMAGFMIDNIANGVLKQWHLSDLTSVLQDSNATLLDVRTISEYEHSHIEGFKNIPVDELRDHLSEIEKDKPVYVICQSGLRSYIATRILSQNGYDAYNFAGGFRFYEAVMHDRSLVEKETACGMDL